MRIASGLACAVALLSCRTAALPAPGPRAPDAAVVSPATLAGDTYRVVTEESLLTIRAWRGGALAKAGHNHVIASRDLTGEIVLPEDAARAQFELRMPVELLTIDEPDLRRAAGDEFPPEIPESARQGTRRNMLGEALLDAANHPAIVVRATQIVATAEGYSITAEIEVRDHVSLATLPVRVQREGDRLVARGDFKLTQSGLGLVPFSVMLGALQVRDELDVSATIVARRQSPSNSH